jgi:mono/diheme cytochrome c family protein
MIKVFKWIGVVLGLLIVVVAVLFFIGNSRLNKTYHFPPSNITLPTDAPSIAYGKHRAETLCEGCHGKDLSGVEKWFNAGPLGVVDSANLTSGDGGVGREFSSNEDFVRAIRHGVDPDGRPIFMPAVVSTSQLSDQDLASIIAYVRTVPPVNHITHGHNFTPLAKILLAAGKLGKLPVELVSHEPHVAAPERGANVAYGEYMVNTNDCRICHGLDLNGGPFPDPTITKISPNITPGGEIGFWTEEQFLAAIRTGLTPNGHELDAVFMPWKSYNNMTDYELKAIFLYLQSVPTLEQYTK